MIVPGLVSELAVSSVALHSLNELGLHLGWISARVPVTHSLVVAVRVLGVGRTQTSSHQLYEWQSNQIK